MSNYHCHFSVVSAGQGQNIIAAAAYVSRARLEDNLAGEVKDYSSHSDEVKFSGIFVPDEAPDRMKAYKKRDDPEELVQSREDLWNEVQENESRKDAQFARQMVASLPHELTEQEQQWFVREFVRDNFMKKGMIADVNIHGPGDEGDERNVHVHILLTMREIGWKDFAIQNKESGETYSFSSLVGLKSVELQEFMKKGRHIDRDVLPEFDIPKGKKRPPGKAGEIKEEVGKLFRQSKSAKEFKAKLEANGYVLGNLGAKGFGLKNREWNTIEQLEKWREAWAVFGSKQLEKAAKRRREAGLNDEAEKLETESKRFAYSHLTLKEQRKKAQEFGDIQHAKDLDREPQRYKGWYQTTLERRQKKRKDALEELFNQQKAETTVLSDEAEERRSRNTIQGEFSAAKKITRPPFLYRLRKPQKAKTKGQAKKPPSIPKTPNKAGQKKGKSHKPT